MFSLGLISDIHSNFNAIETVLSDMKRHYPDISEIFFIGDLCGYGPDPKQSAELILNNRMITKILQQDF